MNNIVENAHKLAQYAHANQFRKWGKQEPFITHPLWVSNKAKELGFGEVVQAAGILHDTAEDVAIPTNRLEYWKGLIIERCGETVWNLVWELTNPSDRPEFLIKYPNPSRAQKWAVNLAHIKQISDDAKVLKMIDRLHNLLTATNAPVKWKKKYLGESIDLVEACYSAHEDNVKVTELIFELEDEIDWLETSLMENMIGATIK